jgi:hypothetical protein
MNYELLFKEIQARCIRIALIGANGGFSRTLLVQCRAIKNMDIAALCDLDLDGTLALLTTLGFTAESVRICRNSDDVRHAVAGQQIVLVNAAMCPPAWRNAVQRLPGFRKARCPIIANSTSCPIPPDCCPHAMP